jgi:HEAT repeat protein
LSQIGSAEPAGIQAMIVALERRIDAKSSSEIELARAAAEALGFLGTDAVVAVPVLQRAAQTDDELLRQAAAISLGKIGPPARGAQPLLFDLMVGDDSAIVRDAATTALGQTGPDAWPLLEPLFDEEDAELRERAVHVASAWPSIATTSAPRIELLLDDREPRVQLAAARSWRGLTRRHERVWPVLIELLNDADRQIRRAASQELQAIVKSDAVSDDEFRALNADSRPAVRSESIRLLRLVPRRER